MHTLCFLGRLCIHYNMQSGKLYSQQNNKNRYEKKKKLLNWIKEVSGEFDILDI